jgi:predicted translin family RNA/ssDNA-binding protein
MPLTKEFPKLRAAIATYDASRDMIIRECRDITKSSKQAIYDLHRDDPAAAKKNLAAAEAVMKKLLKTIKSDPTLRTGGFSASLEEYTEAKAFLRFLEKGDLITCAELGVEPEEYLLGLCDLTGELVRYAVRKGTAKDKRAVQNARDMVDGINGELLQFDLRNGELRKKYDSVKYNLQKIETVLYDLSLRGRVAE